MKFLFLLILFLGIGLAKNQEILYKLVRAGLSHYFGMTFDNIGDENYDDLRRSFIAERIKQSEITTKEVLVCKEKFLEFEQQCEKAKVDKDKCEKLDKEIVSMLKDCENSLVENNGLIDKIKEGYYSIKTIITNAQEIAKFNLEQIKIMTGYVFKEFKIGILETARLTKFAVKLIRLYHNKEMDSKEKANLMGKYLSSYFKAIINLGFSAKRVISFIVNKFMSVFLSLKDYFLSLTVTRYLYNLFMKITSD